MGQGSDHAAMVASRADHELSGGIDRAINLVGGRWAVLILAALSSGPRRFSQLRTSWE